jgi:hypothetical protein
MSPGNKPWLTRNKTRPIRLVMCLLVMFLRTYQAQTVFWLVLLLQYFHSHNFGIAYLVYWSLKDNSIFVPSKLRMERIWYMQRQFDENSFSISYQIETNTNLIIIPNWNQIKLSFLACVSPFAFPPLRLTVSSFGWSPRCYLESRKNGRVSRIVWLFVHCFVRYRFVNICCMTHSNRLLSS